jgi:hypothetical protein
MQIWKETAETRKLLTAGVIRTEKSTLNNDIKIRNSVNILRTCVYFAPP